MELSSIEQALAALREGKPVLVADAADRENEGDAIIAAQYATEQWIAWMVNNTSGFLCVPMEEARANELELPVMTTTNRDPHKTNYTSRPVFRPKTERWPPDCWPIQTPSHPT